MRGSAMLYRPLHGQPHCTPVVAQRNLYIPLLLLLCCAVEDTLYAAFNRQLYTSIAATNTIFNICIALKQATLLHDWTPPNVSHGFARGLPPRKLEARMSADDYLR